MNNSSKQSITIWSIVGILVVGSIATMAIFGSGGPAGSSGLTANLSGAVDRVNGPENAPIELMEYGDFQCPACGLYYPIVEKVMAEFPGQVKFVFRHFPLRSIHINAEMSSRAAEAAGQQRKFWEMYGLLYENQKAWSNLRSAESLFASYAGKLGLDTAKFKKDLYSDVVVSKIENDLRGGEKIGINHTPTFFVNGKEIENPNSFEAFKTVIENALKTVN